MVIFNIQYIVTLCANYIGHLSNVHNHVFIIILFKFDLVKNKSDYEMILPTYVLSINEENDVEFLITIL